MLGSNSWRTSRRDFQNPLDRAGADWADLADYGSHSPPHAHAAVHIRPRRPAGTDKALLCVTHVDMRQCLFARGELCLCHFDAPVLDFKKKKAHVFCRGPSEKPLPV